MGPSRGHSRCPAPTTSQQTHNGKWPDQVFPLFKRGYISGLLYGIASILNVSNSEMSYSSTTTYLRLKQALACWIAVCFKLSTCLAAHVKRVSLRMPKTDWGQ